MKSPTLNARPSLGKRLVRRLALALLLFGVCSIAVAKLPPPTEQEKAQAEATKAKAAADAEKEKALLAKVQDRIAEHYIASQRAKGVTVTPTPIASSGSSETPSAALNTRPREKAGAYNEAVTPQSAPRATSGTQTGGAPVPQPGTNTKGE